MKKSIIFPLRYKILLVFIVFLFMPLLIASFLVYARYYKHFLEKEITLSSQKINEATVKLNDYIEQINQLSFDVCYNDSIQEMLLHFNPDRFIGPRVESRYFQNQFGINRLDNTKIYYLKVMAPDRQIGISVGNTFPEEEAFDDIFFKDNQKSKWCFPRTITTFGDEQISLVSFYQRITTPAGNLTGILRLDIQEQVFSDLLSEFNYLPASVILLLDQDYELISCSNELKNVQAMSSIKNQLSCLNYPEKEINIIPLENDDYYLIAGLSLSNGWRLVQVIPASDIEKQAFPAKQYTYIITICGILFSCILCVLLSFFITKPLTQLLLATQELQKGHLNAKANIHSQDEFSLLADSFNQMTDYIEALIQKNAEIKRQETMAELLYMQSQINPHFLYNTLDSIRWSARLQEDFIVSQQVEMLSDLFRYYLSRNSKFVTFQEEIHYINNYLEIQKLRYKDRLSYHILFDNDVTGLYTLRLILQPLVENAIVHGLERKMDDGHILITGKLENQKVIVSVEDDGLGSSEEIVIKHLNEKETSKAFALRNINDRLRLHFGEEYGLLFHSILGTGTKVTLKLPVLTEPPDYDQMQ